MTTTAAHRRPRPCGSARRPSTAATTVSMSASGTSSAAAETESGEPTAGSAAIETTDTTDGRPRISMSTSRLVSATDGYVGASDDVQLDRCELDGDHWVAAGTVTNSTSAGAAYRIYVAFNPPDTATARGLVQVDFLVPDGETPALGGGRVDHRSRPRVRPARRTHLRLTAPNCLLHPKPRAV